MRLTKLDTTKKADVCPTCPTAPRTGTRLRALDVAREAFATARLEDDETLWVLPDGAGVADWAVSVDWRPPATWVKVAPVVGIEGEPSAEALGWLTGAIERAIGIRAAA